jgi:hypothetical protein
LTEPTTFHWSEDYSSIQQTEANTESQTEAQTEPADYSDVVTETYNPDEEDYYSTNWEALSCLDPGILIYFEVLLCMSSMGLIMWSLAH